MDRAGMENEQDVGPVKQGSAGGASLRGDRDAGQKVRHLECVVVYTLGLLEPNILAKASLRV